MQPNGPSWKLRRRAVFGSLLFAASIIVYVGFRWEDTALAETLVLGAYGLMGAVIAAYTGFAVMDDRYQTQYREHDEYLHEDVLDGSDGARGQDSGAIVPSVRPRRDGEHSDY
jgi:hypothetical protein